MVYISLLIYLLQCITQSTIYRLISDIIDGINLKALNVLNGAMAYENDEVEFDIDIVSFDTDNMDGCIVDCI